MDKWKVLAQAFENRGVDLGNVCTYMHTLCEDYPEFDVLYVKYAELLNSMNAQVKHISKIFDEIDN